MYTNNAYLNDSHIDRKDKSNPLVVTMCGTYKLYTKPKLPTWRPRGRVDFQLLYVASGKAHFYFDKDSTDTIVHAGHMVLYRPKEPQKYVYYAKDHTEVYWVHFTGSSVTNLLRSYGITKDKRVFYCGSDPEYKNLFSPPSSDQTGPCRSGRRYPCTTSGRWLSDGHRNLLCDTVCQRSGSTSDGMGDCEGK